MKKDIKIAKSHSGKRLLSILFDYLSVFLGAIVLYFVSIYAIFTPIFGYQDKLDEARSIENHHNLNMKYGLDYEVYEEALLNFYFEAFPEEMKDTLNKAYLSDYSLTHLYNISVLRLPAIPTYDNYSSDYFEYVLNDDGTFDVDTIGLKKEGLSGYNYERNMRDIFHTSYSFLKEYLYEFDDQYHSLKYTANLYEVISRTAAISLSVLVFYIIIPLINKHGATLFEKIYDLGHVNSKNGYDISKYKIILRALIYFVLPILGIYIMNEYSLILLIVFYLFINNLVMIFSKNNADFANKLLRIDTVFVSESLIFKNRKEEIEYENSDEYKKINEATFLDLLKGIKPIDKHENKE